MATSSTVCWQRGGVRCRHRQPARCHALALAACCRGARLLVPPLLGSRSASSPCRPSLRCAPRLPVVFALRPGWRCRHRCALGVPVAGRQEGRLAVSSSAWARPAARCRALALVPSASGFSLARVVGARGSAGCDLRFGEQLPAVSPGADPLRCVRPLAALRSLPLPALRPPPCRPCGLRPAGRALVWHRCAVGWRSAGCPSFGPPLRSVPPFGPPLRSVLSRGLVSGLLSSLTGFLSGCPASRPYLGLRFWLRDGRASGLRCRCWCSVPHYAAAAERSALPPLHSITSCCSVLGCWLW